MRLFVVIPTYNEAGNLREMSDALFGLPFADLNIVIVDDNSPDGTGRLADELAERQQLTQSCSMARPRVMAMAPR